MSVDTSGADWVDAETCSKPNTGQWFDAGPMVLGGPYRVISRCGSVLYVECSVEQIRGYPFKACFQYSRDKNPTRGRLNLKTGEFVPNEVTQETPQPEQPTRVPQVGERWRSRDGSFVTECIQEYIPTDFALVALCSDGASRIWKINGRYRYDEVESCHDLVELVEEAQPAPPPTNSIEARQYGDEVEEVIEELEVVARWRSGSVEVSIEDGEMSHRVIGRGTTAEDAATLSRLYDRAARRWAIISKQLREGGK